MADETLMMLARDVRNRTLKLLDGLNDSDAQFKAPGLNNSILWHAGHGVMLMDHLGLMPLTGAAVSYPPGWFEIFSWKSDPRTVTAWPPVADVRAVLVQQVEKLLAELQRTTEQQLAKVIDQRGRTLRYSIMHGLHDEAIHQGEMWLLRKMMSK